MGQWGTYSLEDFLLFQPRVYWRLFELNNEALWPLAIAALLLGAAILVMVLRPAPWSGRSIALALGVAWIWVAWSFLWGRYATINWAIAYAAPLFALQGLLLIFWPGPARPRAGANQVGRILAHSITFLSARPRAGANQVASFIGLALYLYALFLHPLVALLAGRPIQAAEVFAMAPDPTAIATLGLVSMAQGRIAWLLLAIPILWCMGSALTLYAMGAPEALIPLVAALLAITACLAPGRK